VAPDIFSIVSAVLSLTYQTGSISSCAQSGRLQTVNFRGHMRIVGPQFGTCYMLLLGTLEVTPRFLENLYTLGIVVLFTSDGYNFLKQTDIKYVVPSDDIVEHCMLAEVRRDIPDHWQKCQMFILSH
jgi:hypothetical protein